MAFVTCPSCGGKGSIPNQLVGKKIKCQKCGTSFQAIPATAEFPVQAGIHAAGGGSKDARGGAIEVDGLDASSWAATAAAVAAPITAEVEHHHDQDHEAHGFTASPSHDAAPHRHYKVLTQKDRFFEGKFDLSRLEEALNHYASQGWVVRAMSTPHVTGFSGGPREEIVVLLER